MLIPFGYDMFIGIDAMGGKSNKLNTNFNSSFPEVVF